MILGGLYPDLNVRDRESRTIEVPRVPEIHGLTLGIKDPRYKTSGFMVSIYRFECKR